MRIRLSTAPAVGLAFTLAIFTPTHTPTTTVTPPLITPVARVAGMGWNPAIFAALASGSSWYVAPNGTAAGDGSLALPWDLGPALSGADGRVKPGDTIYIRAGTYRGLWVSQLNGTPEAPIKVRAYQRDHVILDGHHLGGPHGRLAVARGSAPAPDATIGTT